MPADNPFRGRAGARPENYAYGLRNPYRFSFDRRTGNLAIGDVGQDDVEEIDFVKNRRGRGRARGSSSAQHLRGRGRRVGLGTCRR